MEMVLKNALVYTSNEEQPWADTVVVQGGRITYVGEESGWTADGVTPVHDMKGSLVLPGFIDAHTHPTMVTKSMWHVRLPWTEDIDEVLDFIREYGDAHPPEEVPFLYFEYYPSTLFGERKPTKELLDSAIRDRPVFCQDFSEHAHWVNTKMLEMMEVTKDTPDPVPGLEMFARDENGEPTGHLFEMVHYHFLEKMYENLGWRPPEELTPDTVAPFFDFMTRSGVTSLFEALVDDEDVLRAISHLDCDGKLKVYYEGAPRFRSLADLPDAIATVRRYQAAYGSDRIRIRTLKLFLDGTNECGNSALIEPLSSDPTGQHHGEIQMETDELTDCLALCNEADVDVHIHMVGDRAFRVGCDAVEAARARVAQAGGEWRMQVTFAHCELVDPVDMERPARLGIVINWTTHWSGGYFGEESKCHLGEERWNRMYEFNRFADSGAVVSFSSDVVTHYELHRGNPFFGMQVAATRVDPEFPLDPAVHPSSVRPSPDSRLSLERLVKGYTIDAARQLRIDDRVGSIEAGKVANLVVLSADVFSVAHDTIGDVTATTVIFEGDVVCGTL